jgi:hypothetical protein|tara:strand:+ start:2193 stop:2774 length:582 start_codon:yes stop_codon:yes gene_type:complete
MRPFVENEDFELISNYDLVQSAHALLGGIDLDVASSDKANCYVGADAYYTPSMDGLNEQPWSDSIYLFPPGGTYFWQHKMQRWKKTRSASVTLTSSQAVWFRRMYREWMKGNIKQGVFMTNHPDMIRHDQRIFDFPICILKHAPMMIKNTSQGVDERKQTSTTIIVYMPPHGLNTENIEKFIEIYSEKGRIIC